MRIEETMLYFRVLFDEDEKLDSIVAEIELRIPVHERFCSADQHEWYIHNKYRRQFTDLINRHLGSNQLSLF
jgi:hypothetical protein